MIGLSIKRVANVLVTVLAVSILAAFVIQAVPSLIGAEASYVVLSGSMEPTISTGDAVVVNSVDPSTIDRGDVITYTRGTEALPVTHRVVDIRTEERGLVFETKGDANEDADPAPIGAEHVTGKVWFVIPYIGHVILFANTPHGLGVLVGLPIVGLLLSEFYVFARGGLFRKDGGASNSTDEAPSKENHEMRNVAKKDGAAIENAGENQAAVANAQSTGEPNPDGIVLTGMDLKFSAVGFGLFAGYSGFVIYQHPGPIHAAVFVASVLVFAFLGIVLVLDTGWLDLGGSSSEDQSTDESSSETLADGGTGSTDDWGGGENGQ
ncbi:signal peptidase I [Halodesulfurarchaeum sp.]|uniref:signal peptidase I n=1 Tax=Halodesulfurarchaeum sp. TaxID=1980530 RepID=UPI002FC2DE46